MNERPETFRAYYKGEIVFVSNGNWLHPLFEFEEYLSGHSFNRSQVAVEDTIIGKAAAILICRLGIRELKAGTMSRLGEDVLKENDVSYEAERFVDRILCQTEGLLENEDDFERAYLMLRERAGNPVL